MSIRSRGVAVARLRDEERERTAELASSRLSLQSRLRVQCLIANELYFINTNTRAVAASLRAECSVIRDQGRQSRIAVREHTLRPLILTGVPRVASR
jgi:hypothetical protein